MRFGYLFGAAAIQLAVFFLPIAAGIAGLISGGAAGLTAVVTWFVAGIPLSYAAIDALAVRDARRRERSAVSSRGVTGIPAAT